MTTRGRGHGAVSPGRRLSWRDETGKASWRGLLALFLVGSVVYVGYKVIPVRTAAYQFQDALRDEVVLASSRRRTTDENIRRNLVERAAELGLPVQHQSVVVRRPSRRYIVIEADYTVNVEFVGGYVYSWHFTPKAEGPLIY